MQNLTQSRRAAEDAEMRGDSDLRWNALRQIRQPCDDACELPMAGGELRHACRPWTNT
jgi:hypothetical protein